MSQRIDEFFYKQPNFAFIDELKKPFFNEKPNNFNKGVFSSDKIDVSGLYLINEFNDGTLLSKSFEDFNEFATVYEIKGNRYPIILKYKKTEVFESYSIFVNENNTIISAGDTEGIRRGLIYFEDMIISSESSYLSKTDINRKPWLKTRMTRGFFSPTNRPPKNIDELSNDVDYYPDNYLCRLMHDGTNALWIYTRFKDLIRSPFVTGYGEGCEKRIEKLNKIIKKTAEYGIKVYLMVIEPAAFNIGIEDGYEKMQGVRLLSQYCYCPYSEKGADFLYDSGKRLVTSCPDLAGFITIMGGERLTTCAMIPTMVCDKCKNKVVTEIEALTMKQLAKGAKSLNPDFEVVSWTYGHRQKSYKEISKYISGLSSDIIQMENFEDNGRFSQLGKTRYAIDYWLSYVGPSNMYKFAAKKAKENGVPLWAKMQVCTSHENSTLPYIPSPMHIFMKLKHAKALGVSGIVECWYFGNYPSIMSKAVGELAFENEIEDYKKFIPRFAEKVYGVSAKDSVVKCWEYIYKSYVNYPFNTMFSYYGPFHDGVVWDLALKPKNLPLPRTWQLTDVPDGDRIAECFMYGHTHEEVILLFERVVKFADKALEAVNYSARHNQRLEDLISVVKAYNVLANSAYNILKFYKLRKELGDYPNNSVDILAEMKGLVNKEIENSSIMIELCKNDGRLGYHSEAEGYKFFDEKLEKRIDNLKNLLYTDFAEVEKRIQKGQIPLEFYQETEDENSFRINQTDIEKAEWQFFDKEKACLRLAKNQNEVVLEIKSSNIIEEDEESYRFVVLKEFEPMYPSGAVFVRSTGEWFVDGEKIQHLGTSKSACLNERKKWKIDFLNEEKTHVRIAFSLADIKEKRKSFGLAVLVNGISWQKDEYKVSTLGKPFVSPRQYKKIFFR